MTKRYVAEHPKYGYFLGEFLGLGFWSRLDPVDQTSAITFMDSEECLTCFQNSRAQPYDYEQLTFLEVELAIDEVHATIEDIVTAGGRAWNLDP